jgi:hypothetical protein
MSALALQRTVADLVAEYEAKRDASEVTVAAFHDAVSAAEMGATVHGAFAGGIFYRGAPSLSADGIRANLLKSGWRAIYARLQIDRVASAKDKRLFEQMFEDRNELPELTMETAKATFGKYILDPRANILRGLAEVFCDLDPAYRSHSKVKIGVKGLPKRVILSSVGGWGSYGRDKLRDILNALARFRGEPVIEHSELSEIDNLQGINGHIAGEVVIRGVTIRKFKNGNAHVMFGPEDLLSINRALAEFYGDVLPDAEPAEAEKKPGTEVAKNLQFYWTPAAVVERALEKIGMHDRGYRSGANSPCYRVLEPSCGDGRILDMLATRGHRAFGIEVHAGRAAEARAKGHSVQTANFLDCPANLIFDRVVMNPPFYGRHYLKHVRHALRFLRPGGMLVTILPATAWYDHKELDGDWDDLPVGSFAEAGTNVPTGILTIRKPVEEARTAA